MGWGQQPGIPCALALKEGDNEMQTSGVSCRGNDGACLDIVIASEVFSPGTWLTGVRRHG